jgi:hypothetical protein
MIIWSESLDRIIPLCQEFEERLIKLLWRSRPLHNSSSASSTQYQGPAGAGSSAGHGNESLLNCPVSGSVEAFPGPNGGNGNGNRNSNRNSAFLKGPFGELGRDFDELEKGEKEDKEKDVSRLTAHLNGHKHDQKSEDGGRNNITSGRYKRTWYGKKVLVPPTPDDLERCSQERRPIRLYAPLYNGLAAGIALGMFTFLFLDLTTLTWFLIDSVRW